MLTRINLDVDHSENAEDMMRLLHRYKKTYDAVLMDWNMPGVDGIEATKMLKDFYCNEMVCETSPPTVVMISNITQQRIVKEGEKAGIRHFLSKPINPSLLNDMLVRIFRGDLPNTTEPEEVTEEQVVTFERKGSKILLVEDNEVNIEVFLEFLDGTGIEVDVAQNGAEAVEKAQEGDYDLIFMDIQMPVMDGLTAAEKIRAFDKEIPIVALTANAMQEDRQKSAKAGMNDHLSKPIDVRELFTILRRYLPQKHDDIKHNPFILDEEEALRRLGGHTRLYEKMRKRFKETYAHFKPSEDEETLRRQAHDLKSAAKGIGADALSEIALRIEKEGDRTLLPALHKALDEVLEALEEA
jgi:CheY-like chemotaxis protein